MITPTIHLNGTSQDALLEQVTAAATAVFRACVALNQASPHGRDYYPQGENAFTQARAEHADRMARLTDVYRELEVIAQAIADAPSPRRRQA
jgi:hypothetical protein